MKIIDRLVIKSFIGPFVLSFFVAEFVLIMQFLWKYIDEILGKGFSIFEILELIFYYGVTIVPMALPVSVLIASVMVFGDMSEKHELSTMKSAGVSLIRSMRGGIILTFLTFLFSIFASNYLKPRANFQFKKRFTIIRKQKSTLTIEEKIFNDDFNNFIIRVDKKNKDDRQMKDVLIYDHTKPDKSLVNLISSDSAEMYSTENGDYFIMNLYDGYSYQEDSREKNEDGTTKYPFMTTQFETYKKILDMGEFQLEEDELSINHKREDMLNSIQLVKALDSIKLKKGEIIDLAIYDYNELITTSGNVDSVKLNIQHKKLVRLADSLNARKNEISSIKNADLRKKEMAKLKKQQEVLDQNKIKLHPIHNLDSVSHFHQMIDSTSLYSVITRASSIASSRNNTANSNTNRLKNVKKSFNVYKLRLNHQYSFAFICIVFFFIGASLGSIIKKGGYGYSLLIAILFYMVFMISTIMGEKLVKSSSMDGEVGAWVSTIILLPFAVMFTYRALNYENADFSNKILSIFKRKSKEQ